MQELPLYSLSELQTLNKPRYAVNYQLLKANMKTVTLVYFVPKVMRNIYFVFFAVVFFLPFSTHAQPASDAGESSKQVANVYTKVLAHDVLIEKKYTELLKEINALKTSWWEKLVPAFIGFIGVIIGTGLSGWFSQKTQTRQLENERLSSAKEVLAGIQEFRSKQLNEFYAPIQFMLKGTSKVRAQLFSTLFAQPGAERSFIEYHNEPLGLSVITEKGPQKFRLTQHMHLVATEYPVAMPLIKEIVEIGEKISKLILDKGGLAKSDNNDLIDALSEYLGHYSILKDVYSKALQNPSQLNQVRYSNFFPDKLEKLLKTDADKLFNELQTWGNDAQTDWNLLHR